MRLGASALKASPPAVDQFDGARADGLQNPLSHLWLISMKIESVPAPEMRRREQASSMENPDH